MQKWRSDAETAERKLRSCQEDLKAAEHKLKETKQELESAVQSSAKKASHQVQPLGDVYQLQEKCVKLEAECSALAKDKSSLESMLKERTEELKSLQYSFDENLNLWKKEKSELYSRVQEMHAQAEKLRFDCHE